MPCRRCASTVCFSAGGINVAEVRRAVGEQHDAIHAAGEVMPPGGFVGKPHGFFEIGAAFRRDAAHFVQGLARLVAGHAIQPRAGPCARR